MKSGEVIETKETSLVMTISTIARIILKDGTILKKHGNLSNLLRN